VYRESNLKKKKTGWETVAKNLEELKSLAALFNNSTSKIEQALQERLLTEIIEPAEEKILRRAKVNMLIGWFLYRLATVGDTLTALPLLNVYRGKNVTKRRCKGWPCCTRWQRPGPLVLDHPTD